MEELAARAASNCAAGPDPSKGEPDRNERATHPSLERLRRLECPREEASRGAERLLTELYGASGLRQPERHGTEPHDRSPTEAYVRFA